MLILLDSSTEEVLYIHQLVANVYHAVKTCRKSCNHIILLTEHLTMKMPINLVKHFVIR